MGCGPHGLSAGLAGRGGRRPAGSGLFGGAPRRPAGLPAGVTFYMSSGPGLAWPGPAGPQPTALLLTNPSLCVCVFQVCIGAPLPPVWPWLPLRPLRMNGMFAPRRDALPHPSRDASVQQMLQVTSSRVP